MRVLVVLFLTISLGFSNFKFSNESRSLQNTTVQKTEIKNEIYDPIEGYNRVMTAVNLAFYDYVMYPVSYAYDFVMPDPIQGAISNFFDNLIYPIRLINNLLQGKFENSWNETKRFFINITVGFAGFSDAATMHFDMPKFNEDFGQTLGSWGVGDGFYIVWPILGPSSLRDSVGLVGDYFTNPISYIDDDTAKIYINIGKDINEESLHPGAKKQALEGKNDAYIFIRDSYLQKRRFEISR